MSDTETSGSAARGEVASLIVFSPRRHLTEGLPEAVATAAFEFIGPLLENPHRVGKQLRPPWQIGTARDETPHRVLYRIDEDARTVTVLAIGHRGEICRGA